MIKNRFYKKLEDLPKGYEYDLHNYLMSHGKEFFENPDFNAVDMRDFETWPNHPVDRDHLVMYGELMLVDLEMPECDHAYVICQSTRGRHKLSSGRVVHLKPIKSVMPIRNLPSDVRWKNGYFLLPVLL